MIAVARGEPIGRLHRRTVIAGSPRRSRSGTDNYHRPAFGKISRWPANALGPLRHRPRVDVGNAERTCRNNGYLAQAAAVFRVSDYDIPDSRSAIGEKRVDNRLGWPEPTLGDFPGGQAGYTADGIDISGLGSRPRLRRPLEPGPAISLGAPRGTIGGGLIPANIQAMAVAS